jgi:hypothetical protein
MADARPQSPLPQFGLGALLELIAGVALFLALVTQLEWELGLILALLGLLIVRVTHQVTFGHGQGCNPGCLTGLLIISLVLAVLLPAAMCDARGASHRGQCANNLRQLALAFHDYHGLHGHFPPPYIADAEGKPMHSWRVLILPHLGEDALFNAYNLKEPWNSPQNSRFAAQMPSVFHCPSDPQMPTGMTNYFCITGAGRTKPGQTDLHPGDISDGIGNTIALTESSSARVSWLEPRDLTMEDIAAGKNTAGAPCPCSLHGRSDHGVWRSSSHLLMAAMFDARVRSFPANLDAATLQALLTIDGGEQMNLDDIPPIGGSNTYYWVGVWVLLGAELALILFAIVRRVRIARRMRTQVG